MALNLYPSWEVILEDLSDLFAFSFYKIGKNLNVFEKLQYTYIVNEMCFARKADLDDFIINGISGSSQYARASVLYSLYSCSYLTVSDIKYPTYKDWKKNHPNLTLDHKLPRRWFPRLTFDCGNWQGINIQENISKGDDFLEEGLERLELLSSQLQSIKNKYL